MSSLHLEQEGKERELEGETLELIEQYNDIMATLTKSFMRFDKILKDSEEKSKQK